VSIKLCTVHNVTTFTWLATFTMFELIFDWYQCQAVLSSASVQLANMYSRGHAETRTVSFVQATSVGFTCNQINLYLERDLHVQVGALTHLEIFVYFKISRLYSAELTNRT